MGNRAKDGRVVEGGRALQNTSAMVYALAQAAKFSPRSKSKISLEQLYLILLDSSG